MPHSRRIHPLVLAPLLMFLFTAIHWVGCADATREDSDTPKTKNQPAEEIFTRLMEEESASAGAYQKLAWLTDRIGPRLSGSPGADAAVAWAVEELRRDGASRVWTQKVMVPRWQRGEEEAVIVSPITRSMVVTTIGMSIPTPEEGITAEVIEVSSFEELHARGHEVRGKMVLYNQPIERHPEGEGYGLASRLRTRGASEAAKQGAVATLVRSLGTLSARLAHTGAMGYEEGVERIPAAAVSAEDAELLHRLLASGEKVQVHLTLGCRLLPDVESANVLAELEGASLPEEIVVIGGHMDSWDLGTGAIDDGTGVAASMETLRLLKKLDLRPRRTIRVVLFMNEENGNRGGWGYVEANREALERHVAAIEMDSGAGPPLGFTVAAGPGGVEVVRSLAARLQPVGATEVMGGKSGGADIGPMRVAGVPLIGLRQDMTRYFDWHHTAADTLDKVDPRVLAQNVVAMAYLAYALADLEESLPRISENERIPPPY